MDARDEIKARLPIEQLVGQYCQLQKKGRNFVCLCPFHNDSRPSFTVSPDKGIGYCFACNTGGDIFSFYQKIENVDFGTALRQLAEKAGVSLPAYNVAKSPDTKDERARVIECLEHALSIFRSSLVASAEATEYLARRGVAASLIELFGIGYAPDSFSAVYERLLKAGFSRSEIVSSGLAIQRDIGDGSAYDRFRGRIMFPIYSASGSIVGFGGRTLKGDDAKYVNTPEGPLYNKSSILYGFPFAKEHMRTTRSFLLVEGYFDVVAVHSAGIKNVLGVCGTALTDQHAKLLRRYVDSVVLCLDQDKAGRTAAEKAFRTLSRHGLQVSFLSLPAKDPDEFVQSHPTALLSLFQSSTKPYIDFIMDECAERGDRATPQGRKRMCDELFPLLDALPTSVELRSYIEKATQALGIVESELMNDFYHYRNSTRVASPKTQTASTQNAPFSRYELCLGIALQYPLQRPRLSELIPQEQSDCCVVSRAIEVLPPEHGAQEFFVALECSAELREKLLTLSLYCEENFGHWSQQLASREMRKLCDGANRDAILDKQTFLIEALKKAKQAGDVDDEARILTQYQQVIKLARMAASHNAA